jgi:succinylarginine dihydrolase
MRQAFVDCMPGPTNHFGGHSYGNVASMRSAQSMATPLDGALEWLDKVAVVHRLGALQLLLPPHIRPWQHRPPVLTNLSSAFMWMANAGHFFPAADTNRERPQFVPANMALTPHRAYEHEQHRLWLQKLLPHMVMHDPVPWPDEGAANTIRLWDDTSSLYIFVYGGSSQRFPARQSEHASRAIPQMVGCKHYVVAQQHPAAIDRGVFHNDVIAFGFKNVLIYHEDAFTDPKALQVASQQKWTSNQPLHHVVVSNAQLSIDQAIQSYLFNSQVVVTSQGVTLVCPNTVATCPNSMALVQQWQDAHWIDQVVFAPLTASLMNGGGPACLRLALYLSDADYELLPEKYRYSPERHRQLEAVIREHYPRTIHTDDLQKNHLQFYNISKIIQAVF